MVRAAVYCGALYGPERQIQDYRYRRDYDNNRRQLGKYPHDVGNAVRAEYQGPSGVVGQKAAADWSDYRRVA